MVANLLYVRKKIKTKKLHLEGDGVSFEAINTADGGAAFLRRLQA